MTLGLTSSTPTSPVDSGNAEHSMDTTWFYKYLQNQEKHLLYKGPNRNTRKCPKSSSTSSSARPRLAASLSLQLHSPWELAGGKYQYVTDNRGQWILHQRNSKWYHEPYSNFLNGHFLKCSSREVPHWKKISGGQVSCFHNLGGAGAIPRCLHPLWW